MTKRISTASKSKRISTDSKTRRRSTASKSKRRSTASKTKRISTASKSKRRTIIYIPRRRSRTSSIIKKSSSILKSKKVRSGFIMLLPTMLLVTFIVSLLVSKTLRKKITDKLVGDIGSSAVTQIDKIKVYLAGAMGAGEIVAEQKSSFNKEETNKNIWYYLKHLNPITLIKRLYNYIKNKFFNKTSPKDAESISEDISKLAAGLDKKEKDILVSHVEKATRGVIHGIGKGLRTNQEELGRTTEDLIRNQTKYGAIGFVKGLGDAVLEVPRWITTIGSTTTGVDKYHGEVKPYFSYDDPSDYDENYSPPSSAFHTPRESLSYLNYAELHDFINTTINNQELSIYGLANSVYKIFGK